jgi:integrase
MARLIAKVNQRRVEEGRSELLAPARLDDLRHIHATTLLPEGVPVHVVANRLGHADPSITVRVYAHVMRH